MDWGRLSTHGVSRLGTSSLTPQPASRWLSAPTGRSTHDPPGFEARDFVPHTSTSVTLVEGAPTETDPGSPGFRGSGLRPSHLNQRHAG